MHRTRDVTRAAEVLAAGGLVAVPTETVYGLAADATNEAAVRRIFEVKGRPPGHPLIVHVHSAEGLARCVREVPAAASLLAERFWPGPLTLILERAPSIPDAVTGGRDTVAVRSPDHPLTRRVLELLDRPLAAPSANRFGQVSPTTAEAVETSLGEDVDLVLDGGPCRVGVESTIVDLTGDVPVLLRPGGTPREEIESVLGVGLADDTGPARAPGMLPVHYAPEADVVAVEEGDLEAVLADFAETAGTGVLCTDEVEVPKAFERLEAGPDTETYARRLYTLLRDADRRGITTVVAVLPPAGGLGTAIRDRLARAASRPR